MRSDQNDKDGSATETLAKVAAERRRLKIQESPNTIRDPKPLGYEIPGNWKWRCLGDLLVSGPTNGFSPRAVDYETPVRSLTLSATTSGVFKGEHAKFIADEISPDSDLWLRDLGGEFQVTDISRGLCRKLKGKNAHTFLLPIPNNGLKEQVWDESNPTEKIRPKPHFCVEPIFWGADGLDDWFRTDGNSGVVKFKGDKHKVKFAKEVVPTLETACFEPFRPIFDFIKSKCSGDTPA